MSTKGPSNRYGETNGSKFRNTKRKHINYQWARDFNYNTVNQHFNEHGLEFNCKTVNEYVARAVKFANNIDNRNNRSVVDMYGTTYKYNIITKELVIVNKKGIIRSYYKVNNRFHYVNKKGDIKWIIIN